MLCIPAPQIPKAEHRCCMSRDSPAVRWQSIAEALKQLQGDRVLPAKQLLQTGNPRMLLATLAWLFSCRPGDSPGSDLLPR